MKRGLEFDEGASTSKEDSEVSTDLKKKYQGQSIKQTFTLLDGSMWYAMWKKFPNLPRGPRFYKHSLSIDEDIRKTHMEFLNAGATIIRTNTTTAFFSLLAATDWRYKLEDYKELIRKTVEIATNAVNKHNYNQMKEGKYEREAFVVGSCGHLDQNKGMSDEKRKNEYRLLIKTLSDAGIYRFCLESIQSRKDAEMLIELLNELQTMEIGAFIMFKLNKEGGLKDEPDWTRTAYWFYQNFPLYAVGINCVLPDDVLYRFQNFEGIQRKLLTKIPLVVCIDKGKQSLKWCPMGEYPLPFYWVDLNIRFIGGCCYVHAKHLSEIREELKNYNGSSN